MWVLCIRVLTACGISWCDFSSNHFDYENNPTMYMFQDFLQIIKFLTQMVWIFKIHIDWLIEWIADEAHLHGRAFSTVFFQCPNFRNGSPNTKLFHQNTSVIGGQKEFLPKQKLLLTTAHRRWSRGRWSEDRTPHHHIIWYSTNHNATTTTITILEWNPGGLVDVVQHLVRHLLAQGQANTDNQ